MTGPRRLYLEYLEGRVYCCKYCGSHLATVDELVSKVMQTPAVSLGSIGSCMSSSPCLATVLNTHSRPSEASGRRKRLERLSAAVKVGVMLRHARWWCRLAAIWSLAPGYLLVRHERRWLYFLIACGNVRCLPTRCQGWLLAMLVVRDKRTPLRSCTFHLRTVAE